MDADGLLTATQRQHNNAKQQPNPQAASPRAMPSLRQQLLLSIAGQAQPPDPAAVQPPET